MTINSPSDHYNPYQEMIRGVAHGVFGYDYNPLKRNPYIHLFFTGINRFSLQVVFSLHNYGLADDDFYSIVAFTTQCPASPVIPTCLTPFKFSGDSDLTQLKPALEAWVEESWTMVLSDLQKTLQQHY